MRIQGRITVLHQRAAVLALLLSLSLPWATHGASAEQGTPADSPVAMEVFNAPRSKKLTPPSYPPGESLTEKEGWVHLNLMVDPQGKPYEVMVTDSSGNKEFEKAALRAADNWTFEPGTLNDKPIDASHEIKITFRMTDPVNGASPKFVKQYRDLMKAVSDDNKASADAIIGAMGIQNLYEDAYFGLAHYYYARKWGTETQQLTALRRAVAREKKAIFLPKDGFAAALVSLFRLEFNALDFSKAMETWDKLQAARIDDKLLAALKPSVDQMRALRTDDRAYAVAGEIGESSWNYDLFKKNFQFEVTEGHLSQVKLRCEKNYVFFAFDPELQYRVADNAGECTLELIGDPATKFKLIQS